jgi:outer membrane protein assembly factor BamD (BamD/ComL family)
LPEQAESREDRGEQEVGENVAPSGPSEMFHTALQYLDGSEQDQAIALFRDILSLYPESPYETQVRLFLSLTSRMRLLEGELKGREEKVRRLSEELEKLKEIILRESAVRPPE